MDNSWEIGQHKKTPSETSPATRAYLCKYKADGLEKIRVCSFLLSMILINIKAPTVMVLGKVCYQTPGNIFKLAYC